MIWISVPIWNSVSEPDLVEFLDKLTGKNKTIITWFGNPYGIARIKSLENADGLVLAYQDNKYTEDLSAQLIFGGIGAQGALPVTINEKWPSGFGYDYPWQSEITIRNSQKMQVSLQKFLREK